MVIPTYNAAATIGAQLEALAGQVDSPSFEVIVADNGSTDDLEAAAQPWSDRLDVRVIDASARRGPSAARNLGTTAATGGIVLYCDADDVVSPLWVAGLVAALQKSPLVGGRLELMGRAAAWVPIDRSSSGLPEWEGCPYAFAGNMGVRRDVWERIGGWDESLLGAEEVDFAWRAREAGFAAGFAGDAVVRYNIGDSLRRVLRQQYNSGRGTAQLAAKVSGKVKPRRSWKARLRHRAILVSRFPRRLSRSEWAAWASTLAWAEGNEQARQ